MQQSKQVYDDLRLKRGQKMVISARMFCYFSAGKMSGYLTKTSGHDFVGTIILNTVFSGGIERDQWHPLA